jgi:hypothetical protein
MWILHSPPYCSNKYFYAIRRSYASNNREISGDSISSTIIYGYAETGTAATKSCSDEKPMEITTQNQNQLLILHLFAILLLEIKPIPIA